MNGTEPTAPLSAVEQKQLQQMVAQMDIDVQSALMKNPDGPLAEAVLSSNGTTQGLLNVLIERRLTVGLPPELQRMVDEQITTNQTLQQQSMLPKGVKEAVELGVAAAAVAANNAYAEGVMRTTASTEMSTSQRNVALLAQAMSLEGWNNMSRDEQYRVIQMNLALSQDLTASTAQDYSGLVSSYTQELQAQGMTAAQIEEERQNFIKLTSDTTLSDADFSSEVEKMPPEKRQQYFLGREYHRTFSEASQNNERASGIEEKHSKDDLATHKDVKETQLKLQEIEARRDAIRKAKEDLESGRMQQMHSEGTYSREIEQSLAAHWITEKDKLTYKESSPDKYAELGAEKKEENKAIAYGDKKKISLDEEDEPSKSVAAKDPRTIQDLDRLAVGRTAFVAEEVAQVAEVISAPRPVTAPRVSGAGLTS